MVKTTVGGIITKKINGEDHILLTLRSIKPYKDHWCLPGGHIDEYEKAEDAIKREIEEETGLHFQGEFYAYFNEIIPDKQIHAVVLIYHGTASGVIKIREEVTDIQWFKFSDALQLPLAFQHQDIINTYKKDLRK